MNFADKLNEYIALLQCTGGSLADASGLSESVLSRYRKGNRTPSAGSESLQRLVDGIVRLAEERDLPEITRETVEKELSRFLVGNLPEDFSEKFNQLLEILDINASRMAREINYDASFLSRLRNGKRVPADPYRFIRQLASYIAVNYSDGASLRLLAGLTGNENDTAVFSTPTGLSDALFEWFYQGGGKELPSRTPEVLQFLRKLDSFDLNDYIRAVQFGAVSVPFGAQTVSTQMNRIFTKTFVGTEGQKRAELEFLNAVGASDSKEPLFMYSDMDMTDMSKDMEFSKAWMTNLAMVLKKGQPIAIVHNLNRPFHELMLGLEAYIPLYMTGLVSPYYFKGVQSNVFRHFLYTTEGYALTGEAIAGFHDQAKFLLTDDRGDVEYCRERSKCLLQKALPLMDIFTAEKKEEFRKFLTAYRSEIGKHHVISAALPVFTLPADVLERTLRENGFAAEEIEMLKADAEEQGRDMEHLLERDTVLAELPLLEREEYERYPLTLLFSRSFSDKTVTYSYEEYLDHLEATKRYAQAHPNYRIVMCSDFAFRNIHIDILQGQWVWISKHTSPAIHFVIHHPKLRDAIEKMYVAVRTEGD